MKHCLLLLALVAVLALSAPAQAQRMSIDTSPFDGVCNASDVLSTSSTSFEVWLDTTFGGAVCTQNAGIPLDVTSYVVAVRYSGGTMTYNSWTNAQPSFVLPLVVNATAGNDAVNAYAIFPGGTPLAAGLHKLGTMNITVSSGNPVVSIIPLSGASANPTSFGTSCPGSSGANTYVMGTDWMTVCGTAAPTPTLESTWAKIKKLYH